MGQKWNLFGLRGGTVFEEDIRDTFGLTSEEMENLRPWLNGAGIAVLAKEGEWEGSRTIFPPGQKVSLTDKKGDVLGAFLSLPGMGMFVLMDKNLLVLEGFGAALMDGAQAGRRSGELRGKFQKGLEEMDRPGKIKHVDLSEGNGPFILAPARPDQEESMDFMASNLLPLSKVDVGLRDLNNSAIFTQFVGKIMPAIEDIDLSLGGQTASVLFRGKDGKGMDVRLLMEISPQGQVMVKSKTVMD